MNWIKWAEDSFDAATTRPSQFGIFIDPMNNATRFPCRYSTGKRAKRWRETGKLGIADSLLANVQLAFAAADADAARDYDAGRPARRATGRHDSRSGGVDGPLTFNLSAESVLALAQTADPAPTFAAHPSPDWVVGRPRLATRRRWSRRSPGRAVAPPAARPARRAASARRSGKTGPRAEWRRRPAGLQHDGPERAGDRAGADPAPAFVAHAVPPLGLGRPGFLPRRHGTGLCRCADPRPLTGSLTGKLGTADSLLGGVRLALGLEEGESNGAIVHRRRRERLVADRARPARRLSGRWRPQSTISLTVAAGRNNLLSAAAESHA